MKKFIGINLVIMLLILSLPICALGTEPNEASITVEKYTKNVNDIAYTNSPYTVTATYKNGDDSEFTKKTWFRVDTVSESADLMSIYKDYNGEQNILDGNLTCDITLNGTYVFCGWLNDNEGDPDCIERIDITDIAVERPMAWMEVYPSGDYGSDEVADILIKNMDCEDGAYIKRYALVKNYELQTGGWPTSLSPENCNIVFDKSVSELYEKFANCELLIGEESADDSVETIPFVNQYAVRDIGTYMLFIEDSNGNYNYIGIDVGSCGGENPKISVDSAEGGIVRVKASSDSEIARFDYAVLSSKDMVESANRTDEYFLEKDKYVIENNTIVSNENLVICAVDVEGNANYLRVSGVDSEFKITNIALSLSGDEPETFPINEPFNVYVSVSNLTDTDSNDYVFLAVYDKRGALLCLEKVDTSEFLYGDMTATYTFKVPAQTSEIKRIKAYVWSGLGLMQPLSDAIELEL